MRCAVAPAHFPYFDHLTVAELDEAAEQAAAYAELIQHDNQNGGPSMARPIPQDFATFAPGKTMEQLRCHYHCRTAAIVRWRRETGIGPQPRNNLQRPMPDDFREVAPGKSLLQLVHHYHAANTTVARWRDEAGIPAMTRRDTALEIPAGFTSAVSVMTITELGEWFHRSRDTIARWCKQLNVKPLKIRRQPHAAGPLNSFRTHATVVPRGDGTLAGRAADYLRRRCAVYHCTATGSFDPKGTHWRCGILILSSDELIARARSKGFDPEDWRKVAA